MTQASAIDRTAESLLAFWAEAGVDAMLLDLADRPDRGGESSFRPSRRRRSPPWSRRLQ